MISIRITDGDHIIVSERFFFFFFFNKCVSMCICKWEKSAAQEEGNETFILHTPLPQITTDTEWG